jgi:hypothetical protein
VHIKDTLEHAEGYGFKLQEGSSLPALDYSILKKKRDAYVERLNVSCILSFGLNLISYFIGYLPN